MYTWNVLMVPVIKRITGVLTQKPLLKTNGSFVFLICRFYFHKNTHAIKERNKFTNS